MHNTKNISLLTRISGVITRRFRRIKESLGLYIPAGGAASKPELPKPVAFGGDAPKLDAPVSCLYQVHCTSNQ
jgi:hypothetical protein